MMGLPRSCVGFLGNEFQSALLPSWTHNHRLVNRSARILARSDFVNGPSFDTSGIELIVKLWLCRRKILVGDALNAQFVVPFDARLLSLLVSWSRCRLPGAFVG